MVRVALPVPVDELFDYTLSPGDAKLARPGCRVLVGFRGRLVPGVIVECAPSPHYEGALQPVEKLIDTEPAVSSQLLRVLQEEAQEVLCPLGIALANALPAGSAPRITRVYALSSRGRAALESGAARGGNLAILEALRDRPLEASQLRARLSGPGDLRERLDALQRDGLVQTSNEARAPTARTAYQRWLAPAPGIDTRASLAELARAPRQAELLRELLEGGERPIDELTTRFAPRLLRELVARGMARLEERETPRDVLGAAPKPMPELELTSDQAAALLPIEHAVAQSEARTFLLHGVTGSGKTEVYLRAVGAALERGRQALLLVPEITLTHQIVARVRGRFGDGLAVLHSGLRPGERLEQWQRLRAGATPIAVGARSALFAPLENLGVIVIDEEHDGAYKNEEGFLYHARQLAARRARHASCPLVLGSATPALETRFAADRGEVERLVLSHRIGRRPLPAVEIVDLTRERERDPKGRLPVLTRPLRRAIADALGEGGQVILFLNRRGFSTQVLCFDCGHAERCPRCDVALVYHADGQQLRCHYCEHKAPPPETCNGCGAPDTALLGLGTQRLEEEVRAVFPRARSARLDRDTAARRGYTQKVLEELRRGELDVLIGTQMVAKGHDFPGVRVVGVVAADVGLHMPDFRASERTFQLLTQVAGRAGREGAPGRVVVQTFLPHHYAIAPVRHHDYERFYAEELSHRASLGFPPFSSILHVLVSSENPEDAQQGAQSLAHAADSMLGACERMGPAPAPLARLRGRHRVQMLVKGPAAAVHEIARALQENARKLPEGVHAHLDAHPIQML